MRLKVKVLGSCVEQRSTTSYQCKFGGLDKVFTYEWYVIDEMTTFKKIRFACRVHFGSGTFLSFSFRKSEVDPAFVCLVVVLCMKGKHHPPTQPLYSQQLFIFFFFFFFFFFSHHHHLV